LDILSSLQLIFAVENETEYNNDGVIYAYGNAEAYNDYEPNNFDPLDETSYCKDYYFIWAPSFTPRIKAQLAIFQLFKDPTVEFTRPYNFHSIRIPKKYKPILKMELFRLGISYDSVYPDIDGIANTINYYKLNGLR
jgi:hypothetical protein